MSVIISAEWIIKVFFCVRVAVEWSCLQDFSLLAGELLLDHLQSLKCTISGLSTVTAALLTCSPDVLYLAAFV